MISKGDVYKVNLDPAFGTEIKKKRTCVVISTNRLNKWDIRFIVAPTTSKKTDKIYSFETLVKLKELTRRVKTGKINWIEVFYSVGFSK